MWLLVGSIGLETNVLSRIQNWTQKFPRTNKERSSPSIHQQKSWPIEGFQIESCDKRSQIFLKK